VSTTSSFEISREDLVKEHFRAVKIKSSSVDINNNVITLFVALLKIVL